MLNKLVVIGTRSIRDYGQKSKSYKIAYYFINTNKDHIGLIILYKHYWNQSKHQIPRFVQNTKYASNENDYFLNASHSSSLRYFCMCVSVTNFSYTESISIRYAHSLCCHLWTNIENVGERKGWFLGCSKRHGNWNGRRCCRQRCSEWEVSVEVWPHVNIFKGHL